MVLAAVTQDGWAFEHASERLQNDWDLVLAKLRHHGWYLEYVPLNRPTGYGYLTVPA